MRIPGTCTFDPSTVVLAHFRMDCGVGMKPLDLIGAWACFHCHGTLDGQIKSHWSRDELDLMHLQGMCRTIAALHKKGMLK